MPFAARVRSPGCDHGGTFAVQFRHNRVKFTPGTSGNPKGRPPRPRAPTEAKLRGDILKASPAIVAGLIAKAAEGDTGAAKVLLDRCLPPLRATEPPVPIPLGDLAEAPTRIMQGVEQGLLSPTQAQALASAVGALTRTLEVLDFEERLKRLEAANANP